MKMISNIFGSSADARFRLTSLMLISCFWIGSSSHRGIHSIYLRRDANRYRHDLRHQMQMNSRMIDENERQNYASRLAASFLPPPSGTESLTFDPCKLPDCFPPKGGIPGGLAPSQTPQLIFFTFDDAVNPVNKAFYDQLFNDQRKNPNGCPIRSTFFNSHNYTVYSLVSDLYKKGHEIGSHSITHREPPSWWEQASIEQYKQEIVGQRNNIHKYAQVPIQEIRSMRVPFLAMGSDNQFTMLQENNFTFDSSMVSRSDPPTWPFTLHQPDKITNDLCSVNPLDCPKKPYKIWEMAINRWYMVSEINCTTAMVDGCRPTQQGQPSKAEALKYLWFNFYRHHNTTTKPPFGINMHAAWFQFSAEYFQAMEEFVDGLLQMTDVWIVPAYKVIEWIRTPTPLSELKDFEPFSCKK